MIHHDFIDPCLCTIDPITLTGLAIGALAGGGAALASSGGGGSGGGSAPTAEAPPAQAAPASNPTGNKPRVQSTTPSFVGSSAAPEQRGFGTNTLLGQ